MIDSVQYNAALAITGAIHGSSREKLYQDLYAGASQGISYPFVSLTFRS